MKNTVDFTLNEMETRGKGSDGCEPTNKIWPGGKNKARRSVRCTLQDSRWEMTGTWRWQEWDGERQSDRDLF